MKLEKAIHLFEQAQEWAINLHKGQLYEDKDYYEFHIVPVAELAMRIAREEGFSEAEVYVVGATALLHDLVENTNATITEVTASFGRVIGQNVLNLTKVEGESPESQWSRALRDTFSTIVKKADLLVNLTTSVVNKRQRLIDKYTTGLRFFADL